MVIGFNFCHEFFSTYFAVFTHHTKVSTSKVGIWRKQSFRFLLSLLDSLLTSRTSSPSSYGYVNGGEYSVMNRKDIQ